MGALQVDTSPEFPFCTELKGLQVLFAGRVLGPQLKGGPPGWSLRQERISTSQCPCENAPRVLLRLVRTVSKSLETH